jgi:hypothetical protein
LNEAETSRLERAVDGLGLRLVDLVRGHSALDGARIDVENGRRARIEDVVEEVEVANRLEGGVLAMNGAEAAGKQARRSAIEEGQKREGRDRTCRA